MHDKNRIKKILKLFSIMCIFISLSQADTLISKNATVVEILDGDTFDVRFDNEVENTRVRFIGLNTTEVNPYSTLNDCYADEATQRLTELVGGVGAIVILKSLHPSFRDQYNRAWRHIFVVENGIEINIVKKMLEEGLAVPLSSTENINNENTYDELYAKIAQIAKTQEVGLWTQENHCTSPANSENTDLKILVRYDANGDDNNNLNGEWVKVRNLSSNNIDISHWWLRDSALNFFRFPASTIVDSGEEVIVYSGVGTQEGNKFYWGSTKPIFSNTFDSAYLLDYLDYNTNDTNTTYSAKGNIKASFLYPCLYGCMDTLENKIKIVANYDSIGNDDTNVNGEWIRITNISNDIINLKDYLLHYDLLGSKSYIFNDDTIMNQGEELYIHMGMGTDSELKKYMGLSSAILANSGGKVWLTTFDNIIINEFSWPCTENCTDSLTTKIQIHANYDAIGDDTYNPNGEWVSISNISKGDIDLKDYLLNYDAQGSQYYFFSEKTILHKDEVLYLYMGIGTDSNLVKYVGRNSGILANSGGRAWLTRLDGITVSEFEWPCNINCRYDAPLEIVEVNYDATGNDMTNPNGEWITIKNTSGTIINIRNWKLKVRGYHFNFIKQKILYPQDQLKIYMGEGNPDNHWGFTEGKLNNNGDVVSLLNTQRILSHCYSWGTQSNICQGQLDNDNDGILNVHDNDKDGDGIIDSNDDFPLSFLESIDTDNDGIGNNTDMDDDGDGISDDDEIYAGSDPLDASSIPISIVSIILYLLDS